MPNLDTLLHAFIAMPLNDFVSLLALAGCLTSLIMLRHDLRHNAQRTRGVDGPARLMLINFAVGILALVMSLLLLNIFRPDFNVFLGFAVASICSVSCVFVMWTMLRERPTFTYGRFARVAAPLVVPTILLGGAVVPSALSLAV